MQLKTTEMLSFLTKCEIEHGLSACTEIIHELSEWIIDCTGGQTMHYLTCTMISSVDTARYGVDWLVVLG